MSVGLSAAASLAHMMGKDEQSARWDKLADDLKEAILNSSVGETIVLKYIRDGVEYISDPAVLGVHPDDQ